LPGAVARLLAGASNFRSVAPFVASDGRRLRADTVFRSGELSRLDARDLQTLLTLNIRLVCDLRSGQEQLEYFSRWPDGSAHVHLDLPERETANAHPQRIFDLLQRHPGDTGALRAMDMLYRRKPRSFAGNLKRLFDAILAGDALPVLIHCHAGKDRTGFMVAMLLEALGISRADIFEDYVTTARYFPVEAETLAMVDWARRAYGHEIAPASAVPLVEARQDYIEATFDEIAKTWGDTDRYFAEAVGLTTGDRDRLKDLLLVQ
jgi:protein-tyrosine phosphatase